MVVHAAHVQTQLLRLTAGQNGRQHPLFVVGVRALGLLHRGRAVQVVHDKIAHRRRIRRHHRADLAHVDALDGAVGDRAFQNHAQDAVESRRGAVQVRAHQHDAKVAHHQCAANRHTGVLVQNHRDNVRAARRRADVKDDGRAHGGQDDREAKLQKDVVRQRGGQRVDALAQADVERQRKRRVDRPPHRLDAQKEEPQHDKRRVDEPHERADIPAGEQRRQHDGQTRRAAKGKVVRRFEDSDADGGRHQTQIQQEKELSVLPQLVRGQVLFQLC